MHYFLCCPRYQIQRDNLLSKVSEVSGSDMSVLPKDHLNIIRVYGSNIFNGMCNNLLIEQSIIFVKSSGRFKKLAAFLLNQ